MSAPAASARYVHATALVLGEAGVLIHGPSGAGKSSLAAALCEEARRDGLFGRLVGDDRIALAARDGRLVARPHPEIAGLLERSMLGLRSVPAEPACVIRLVVDLEQASPPRMPGVEEQEVTLEGVALPRLRLPARPHDAARRLVFAWLDTVLRGAG